MWIVDITDEQHPMPVATWRVPHDEPFNAMLVRRAPATGDRRRQPHPGDVVRRRVARGRHLEPVPAGGGRTPSCPAPGAGQKIVQSNDVFVDKARGLVYLIDRLNGLDILEFTG